MRGMQHRPPASLADGCEEPEPHRGRTTAESAHAASGGQGHTIIVTGWSSIGGRIRPDALALIRAFTCIGVLSAAYLAISNLSRPGNGVDGAFSSALHPGMGLTVAAGMLAASYLPFHADELSDKRRWMAAW